MDLIDTLRSTGAVREFADVPVADDIVARREEPEVKRLLGALEHWALATVVALGRPAHPRKRLRRRPVRSFTTVDRADGPAFDTAQEGSP